MNKDLQWYFWEPDDTFNPDSEIRRTFHMNFSFKGLITELLSISVRIKT